MWIVVATILAKFTITPKKDKDGNDIWPVIEFTTGVTRFDLMFLLFSLRPFDIEIFDDVLGADKFTTS